MRAKDIQRFNKKVCRQPDENGCLLWIAGKKPNGYGAFSIVAEKGVYVDKLSHRVAWEIANGPIPEGMHVCHVCDARTCCNPFHMFLGTTQDNTEDRHKKGRSAKGSMDGNSKLTEADVLDIRKRYVRGVIRLEDLGKEYGVTATQISFIVNRKQWKHI